jgi:hypothetical protein
MRFIFIVLFLVSFGSVSMGGVGDVYLCEVGQNLVIDKETKDNSERAKRIFKISEGSNFVILSGGEFSSVRLKLKKYFEENDYFLASDEDGDYTLIFNLPRLNLIYNTSTTFKIITADCSKP